MKLSDIEIGKDYALVRYKGAEPQQATVVSKGWRQQTDWPYTDVQDDSGRSVKVRFAGDQGRAFEIVVGAVKLTGPWETVKAEHDKAEWKKEQAAWEREREAEAHARRSYFETAKAALARVEPEVQPTFDGVSVKLSLTDFEVIVSALLGRDAR